MHDCYFYGVLFAYWVYKVFSASEELVVVRINWPGHPELLKNIIIIIIIITQIKYKNKKNT